MDSTHDKGGEALALARRFHETYERLAPKFGYTTRDDTRSFDPRSANGLLMIAVCLEVLEGDTVISAVRTQVEPEGTFACPMCGQDRPHSHAENQVVEWLRLQAARFYPDAPIQVCGPSVAGLVMGRLVTDNLGRSILLKPAPAPYHTTDSDGHKLVIQHDPEYWVLANNGHLDHKSAKVTPLYAGHASAREDIEFQCGWSGKRCLRLECHKVGPCRAFTDRTGHKHGA